MYMYYTRQTGPQSRSWPGPNGRPWAIMGPHWPNGEGDHGSSWASSGPLQGPIPGPHAPKSFCNCR